MGQSRGLGESACIWCVRIKPDREFNVEHVIPRAFGTFETDNLTLIKTVCSECNSFFSRDLEPWLTRDTLEGFHRYLFGQKNSAEFKSLGPRSTARIQIISGLYAGAWGYSVPGEGRLGIRAFPQIGFSRQESGPFEWFLLDEIPTSQELKARGYVGEAFVRLCECDDPQDVRRRLAERGIPSGNYMPFNAPRGIVEAEHVFRPSLIHRRGFAKILLNYVASQAGTHVASEARFDGTRRLVMTGVEPDYPYFDLDNSPILEGDREALRLRGHILVINTTGSYVEGIVSLYNRIRHGFRLAILPGSRLGPIGHFFDIANRRIVPLKLKGRSA